MSLQRFRTWSNSRFFLLLLYSMNCLGSFALSWAVFCVYLTLFLDRKRKCDNQTREEGESGTLECSFAVPSRCVAGIRREVGTSYLVPTQAPVDPGLYYYGRGRKRLKSKLNTSSNRLQANDSSTRRADSSYRKGDLSDDNWSNFSSPNLKLTYCQNREPYIPERSLKTIERDNQILFDPSSNSLVSPSLCNLIDLIKYLRSSSNHEDSLASSFSTSRSRSLHSSHRV